MAADGKTIRFLNIIAGIAILLAAFQLTTAAYGVYLHSSFASELSTEATPSSPNAFLRPSGFFMTAYPWIAFVISIVPAALLLAAGIGILQRKNWGRMLFISTCWIGIVLLVFDMVIYAIISPAPAAFGLTSHDSFRFIVIGLVIAYYAGMYLLFRWLIKRFSSEAVKDVFREAYRESMREHE